MAIRIDPPHEGCLLGGPLGRALLEGTDLRLDALQAREAASHGAILGLQRVRRVARTTHMVSGWGRT